MSSPDPFFGATNPAGVPGVPERRCLVWVAAFRSAVLLACLLPPALAGAAGIKVGDPFPALVGTPAAGTVPATSGRLTLVDFWASWCSPCKASFPAYAQLSVDYAGRGLQVVAVSVDENPTACAAFVRRMKPPFAVLLDQGHKLARQVEPPALPTCFLLGPDGRVRYVHTGYHDGATAAELRREIEALLAEPVPTS